VYTYIVYKLECYVIKVNIRFEAIFLSVRISFREAFTFRKVSIVGGDNFKQRRSKNVNQTKENDLLQLNIKYKEKEHDEGNRFTLVDEITEIEFH